MKNSPLYKIIVREFERIINRRTLFLFEIVLPILFFFLFAEIYEKELVRDLPVAIYDADNSSISRQVTRFVDSSPTLTITKNCNSIDEIKREFQQGNIQGAFVFPKDLEKNLKSGKSSTIVVYKNSTNILIGTYLLKESSTIVGMVSGGALLKKLQSSGLKKEKAMSIANPIRIQTSSLYNPTYSYESYLMPGVLLFTFQMMIILTAVLLISSEYSHQTFRNLIQLAENKSFLIILGKTIPHLLIHMVSVILIFGVVFPIYNISNHGGTAVLMLLMVIFIFSSFMIGLLISAWVKDQTLATEIAIILNMPAFILSGLTFPTWGMPLAYTYLSQALPFTHFLNAFLKIYQMGASYGDIINELGILLLYGVISLIGTLIGLRTKMHKQKNETHALVEV